MKFSVVIGNPPYGNRASLATAFVNKSIEVSDYVYYILPLSFVKPSIQKSVVNSASCVYEEELSTDTFPNGIRAVKQLWVSSYQYRFHQDLPTHHVDFEFLHPSHKLSADLMIGAVGSGPSGKVFLSDFSHYQDKHHFIVCYSPEVVKRLVSISPQLRSISLNQNGRGGVCKSDIVKLYSETYMPINISPMEILYL